MGQGLDVRGERSTVDVGAVMQALRERTPSITREEMAAKLIRPLGAYFARHPRARCFLHDSGDRHARFWQQPQFQLDEVSRTEPLTPESAVTLARAAAVLDRSVKPLLGLTACLVLEGRMLRASAVARATLAAHGDRGLAGFSCVWLGLISQCSGDPRAALASYRAAARSDVAPIRQAGLWGGALSSAEDGSRGHDIAWFTHRLSEEDIEEAALSFGVVRETFIARSGSKVLGDRVTNIERTLRGRSASLVEVFHGA
jgi:hypothetical protein